MAAFWLIFTGLAVTQWIFADDSRGRWLAGVQCVLGVGLVIVYLVQARQTPGEKQSPEVHGA